MLGLDDPKGAVPCPHWNLARRQYPIVSNFQAMNKLFNITL
jgi:hypothetical protein